MVTAGKGLKSRERKKTLGENSLIGFGAILLTYHDVTGAVVTPGQHHSPTSRMSSMTTSDTATPSRLDASTQISYGVKSARSLGMWQE